MDDEIKEYEMRNILTAAELSKRRSDISVLEGDTTPLDMQREINSLREECARLSAGWKAAEEAISTKYHNMTLSWHAPGMGEVHSLEEDLEIQCLRVELDNPEQDYVADDDLAKHVCNVLNAWSSTQGALPQAVEVNNTSSYRRTGRTTRMLQHAIELAQAGRAVYLLASDESHANVMRRALSDLTSVLSNPEFLPIKVETVASLRNKWDKSNHRLLHAHPNCILLTDHFVAEQCVVETHQSIAILNKRISDLIVVAQGMLTESHRWDLKIEEEPKNEQV